MDIPSQWDPTMQHDSLFYLFIYFYSNLLTKNIILLYVCVCFCEISTECAGQSRMLLVLLLFLIKLLLI